MKQKLLFLLVLLLTATTGAWATDYTTLAVGDVIKVGDTFSPTADGAFNDNGVTSGKTYTLMRADIDNGYNVTEKTDGAYYVFKHVSDFSPYMHFGKAFAVTAISDGLEVTNIETGKEKGNLMYTLAVHEPTAAGYTVSLKDGTQDAGKWTVKAGTDGSFQSLPLKGVTAVKKAAAPAYTLLSAAATSDVGKVVCAAGHLHDAKTAVPDGCTAVGILGKVTETGHGLILALQDVTSQTWNTINGWTPASYAGTTLKVLPDDDARGYLTSYTTLGSTAVSNWAVAQKSDYEAIFTNLGSTTGDSDGMTYDANVNAYITTGVGGAALDSDYWSATEFPDEDNYAWLFGSEFWAADSMADSYSVRPVLGF